jgi:modulator of FtsH protease
VQHGLPDHDKQLIAIFNRRGPNVMVMSLFVVSGIILACGEPSGLYLLLPASLVALMSGVLNAWHFLLPPSSG